MELFENVIFAVRNNFGAVSKRREMKTERLAASCQHKRRYFFVPLANQASQASQNGKFDAFR